MRNFDNPVMTIAGVVPGAPEATQWHTAYPNPDAETGKRVQRPRGTQGPTMSIAGLVQSTPNTRSWNVPYPNGESIYVTALRAAERKAALEAQVRALPQASAHKPRTAKHAA